MGIATALAKKVLPLLTHPSLNLPIFLRRLHYKTRVADVKAYFASLAEPEITSPSSPSASKISPRQRDAIRAKRNRQIVRRLKRDPGVRNCFVIQLEDHSDNGYILVVEFDNSITSAAEILTQIRAHFDALFPGIPVWGELKIEEDNSIGFAYTYIDPYNMRARVGQ